MKKHFETQIKQVGAGPERPTNLFFIIDGKAQSFVYPDGLKSLERDYKFIKMSGTFPVLKKR